MIGPWRKKRDQETDETTDMTTVAAVASGMEPTDGAAGAAGAGGEVVPFPSPRRSDDHTNADTDADTDDPTDDSAVDGGAASESGERPGRELEPLPSDEPTVPAKEPAGEPVEVLEGTIVPVDPPDTGGGDLLVELGQRRAQWHPVLPAWLRSVEQAKAAALWVLAFVGHVVAFHALRSPLYALRLTLRAPLGIGRLVNRVMAWWWDTEGDAVRLATVTPTPDPEQYLRLARHHDARKRGRSLLLMCVVIMTIPVAGSAWYGFTASAGSPEWVWLHDTVVWAKWVILAVVVVLLGRAGGRADRPVVGPAVVPTRVEKLTSEVVIRALGSLGIAEINKALAKGGTGITFPAPITRDGPGWLAELDLPYGVTVADIVERRDRLASGLRRAVGCVWPESVPDAHAGRLRLWVGDQDMAKAKAPAWPLAQSGTADIFKPMPFGFDQRGRLVAVLLIFSNMLIGAMPRAGKTFALRVILLACALDVRVQLRTFELKGTGDLSALEKVSHHYASGADDDTIRKTVESLREVGAELDRRAKVISGLPKTVCPESKVTPELATKKSLGLFPIVVSVDECQELFSHPTYGKEAEDLCLPIIKRGPALGIILKLATQRPDKDSLPTGISANMGIRFCLRVMGQLENDMVLGTSAYRNGIRATMFGAKDKGIGWMVGNADDPQIVRGANIDAPTADKIADRARALRAKAGTLSGHAIGDTTSDQPRSDLLADILTVVPAGEDKVHSDRVCARLAEQRPEIYTGWSPEQLTAALKPYGVKTSQVWATTDDGQDKNRRGIVRDHITKAVAARTTESDRKRGGESP